MDIHHNQVLRGLCGKLDRLMIVGDEEEEEKNRVGKRTIKRDGDGDEKFYRGKRERVFCSKKL